MQIDKILKEAGLTNNRSTVYMATLEIGSGTGHDIAKAAKLPRTTTYEILEQLLDLGLVSYITKGKGRIYTPEKPEKIKLLLQEKERRLNSILPELDMLLNTKGAKPKVKYYEGIEGIKSVFEDTLTANNKVLHAILSMEDLYKIPGKSFMADYTTKRISAGIKLNVIRSEAKEIEETWPSSTKQNRELHYAPKDMIFPMTMYLYNNKVGIIGTQKENFGLIIESEDLFHTLKNMFDVMWQTSRVMPKID